ncbi:MAG: hypothetical protein Q8K89_01830, partial [Actinomycetota bacterium]|nr:hypothetical protein [Actinomycetota bacterium]
SQDEALAAEADRLGVTQAEIVRRAIDAWLSDTSHESRRAAWIRAQRIMEEIRAKGPVEPSPHRWERGELHERKSVR